jgi:hypothetical protein
MSAFISHPNTLDEPPTATSFHRPMDNLSPYIQSRRGLHARSRKGDGRRERHSATNGRTPIPSILLLLLMLLLLLPLLAMKLRGPMRKRIGRVCSYRRALEASIGDMGRRLGLRSRERVRSSVASSRSSTGNRGETQRWMNPCSTARSRVISLVMLHHR